LTWSKIRDVARRLNVTIGSISESNVFDKMMELEIPESVADFEGVCEIEEPSISVKFVKLFILSESLAFSFRFITFNNMTDELDFEG